MARKDSLIGVIVLVAVVIGLFWFFDTGDGVPIFAAIPPPPIDFAGFTWQSANVCGTFNVQKDGEFLVLSSDNGEGIIETDITGVDEVLVIFEGSLVASCSGSSGSESSASLGGGVSGTEGGSVGDGESTSTSNCINSVGDVSRRTVEPAIWKFKNNFDGTWSSLTSIGVGDIFIVKNTVEIKGTPMLRLSVGGKKPFGCFGGGSQDDTWSNTKLRIFNVVRKEAGFAVCKADEFIQDVNQDGIITPDECFDLATIVLNSEEAIKESFEEKIARIIAEQESKNQGLTDEIERLKALQADTERIEKLENELADTILLLQKLQDREQELLDAIRQDEKITIINQTVIIEKTIIQEVLVEKEGIPVWVKVIGGLVGIFILLKVMRVI